MKITIAGGGNIGTQFAVHCAQAGHRVVMFTSKPERFGRHLTVVDETGRVTHEGDILGATNDAGEAFAGADVIFVTVPADCMKDTARKIIPHVKPGVRIGLIPGTGGGECAFRECLSRGAVVFGLQRVPSVARLVTYGSQVCATGYRAELFAAALPKSHTQECCGLLSQIFQMPCSALPGYLNLTMTPSNPILHTTRLRILFRDYKPGVTYDRIPLFYEEWDDASSELLFQCDAEVQALCGALSDFDLTGVKSLRVHYESDTPEQLTKKISGIAGFKGLKTPQAEIGGRYIPDLNSRYFTADFSFGLAILVQLAGMAGVAVPNMEQTLEWYQAIAVKKEMFRFSDWGITTLEDLTAFYLQ